MPVIYISPFFLLPSSFLFLFYYTKMIFIFFRFQKCSLMVDVDVLYFCKLCEVNCTFCSWIKFTTWAYLRIFYTFSFFLLFLSLFFLCRRKVKEHFAINWWMGVHYVGWVNVSEVYDEKFLSILKQFLLFQLLDGYGCTHLQMSAFLFIMFLFWNIFLSGFLFVLFLANK